MRIFKIWVEHIQELEIDGIKQSSRFWGGSNVSEADALEKAKHKSIKAQKIIDGEVEREEHYVVDIMEEIVDKIDDDNIITRNRYGALVLNSSKMLFIDIDTHRKSFFDELFRTKLSQKELMQKRIERKVRRSRYADLGFRLYETFKGYRLLVTNKDFDPQSVESKRMMKDFNADYLYEALCRRQNCYRARLTPKPYRIKQKKIRVNYPKRSLEEQENLNSWIRDYDDKSSKYSTCRLVKEFGNVEMNQIIAFHDKWTKVKWSKKLA